jgi:hypothetical protein
MSTVEIPVAEVEDLAGGFSPGAGDGGEAPGLVLPEEVVARLAGQLAERARSGEPAVLTGPGGLLTGVIGQVLQAGLAAELGAHLEDPGGEAGGNRRNGSSIKTLNTEVGPARLAVPRDRDGSFVPALVPKQATRSDGLNAVIISLYVKGMSVRDIARHVRQTAGMDLSPDTISRVTDAALEGMRDWQHRPLELFYPVIYIDALVAKVRDGSAVRNKAVNIAVGIDDGGAKRVLGIWVASAEGAKAWAQALAQLRNRGLEEVLFACCDGERPQRCRGMPGPVRGPLAGRADHERDHVPCRQASRHALAGKEGFRERAGVAHVIGPRLGVQAPLAFQVAVPRIQEQPSRPRGAGFFRGWRGADSPQVSQQRAERPHVHVLPAPPGLPSGEELRRGILRENGEPGGLQVAAQLSGQPQLDGRRQRRVPEPGEFSLESGGVRLERATEANA